MYKAFVYSKLKFIEKFKDDDLEKLQEKLKWWFETKRNDQSTEFLICDDEKFIKLLNSTHFEHKFDLERYNKNFYELYVKPEEEITELMEWSLSRHKKKQDGKQMDSEGNGTGISGTSEID